MKVNIDELRSYPHQRMEIPFKEELEGLGAVKPIVGVLMLAASSSGARLTGKVQTLLKLNCHRCLQPYFQSLQVEIDERLVDSFYCEPTKERELFKDDFVDTIPANGILDIDDIVYQAVTLATPTFCLCGDQCPGPELPNSSAGTISLGPTKNSSGIDPRWKNLKTLFVNGETNQN